MNLNISEFQSTLISYLDSKESDPKTKNDLINMIVWNTSTNKVNFPTKIHKLVSIVQHPDFDDPRWLCYQDKKFMSWHSDGQSIVIFVTLFHEVFGQLFFNHKEAKHALRNAFQLYGFDNNRDDKKTEIPVNHSCSVWTHTKFDIEGIDVPLMRTNRKRHKKMTVNEGNEGADSVGKAVINHGGGDMAGHAGGNVGVVGFGVVNQQHDVIGYHQYDYTNRVDMSLSLPDFSINGSEDDSVAVAKDVLRYGGAQESQAFPNAHSVTGESSVISELGF